MDRRQPGGSHPLRHQLDAGLALPWRFAIYADGTRYEGGFDKGVRSGQGRMTMPGGYVFEGTWANGLLNGKGKATYPDGSVYEGDFVDGQRQGQGSMRFAGGQRYEGLWNAGQPVEGTALPEAAETPAGPDEPAPPGE